jgi:hypothetical protein
VGEGEALGQTWQYAGEEAVINTEKAEAKERIEISINS